MYILQDFIHVNYRYTYHILIRFQRYSLELAHIITILRVKCCVV